MHGSHELTPRVPYIFIIGTDILRTCPEMPLRGRCSPCHCCLVTAISFLQCNTTFCSIYWLAEGRNQTWPSGVLLPVQWDYDLVPQKLPALGTQFFKWVKSFVEEKQTFLSGYRWNREKGKGSLIPWLLDPYGRVWRTIACLVHTIVCVVLTRHQIQLSLSDTYYITDVVGSEISHPMDWYI